MKKFLIRISLFFCLLCFTGIILDLFISERLKKCTHERKYRCWNEIICRQPDCNVVIMGSSRAWVQYSPKILESACGKTFYNLGLDGSCIDRQIPRYSIYRQFNKKPAAIIQNLDLFMLNKTNGYEREQFFPYLRSKIFQEYVKNEDFSFCEKWIPCYRYFGYGSDVWYGISGKENEGNESKFYNGYSGIEREWSENDFQKFRKMEKNHVKIDPEMRDRFENYIRQASEENIKIIFVYAPFYIDAVIKTENLDEIRNTFSEISEKYNVPVLDYTYHPISHDRKYFYNAMHLNRQGAELFSEILSQDLIKLDIF